ncbi:hypothetical protein GCM10011351_30010 [Paraliobacillus quinghaiensis]|uniref:Zinc ribbon domain-containing protein n=1 Tax=Paraliobacillus quinghaiensis TaxID=470815 RepID=A0A917TXC6_9BACI|nr:hypothetical protein [Paraliobacillus quinghaiensis]GGM41919.1 hypothetical protein GCM10011351_30010 [Paraliobacillus quinghaiensis]
MPLKPCPSCSHSVSTQAESCPKCGHPINPKTNTKTTYIEEKSSGLSFWGVVGAVILAIIILSFC